MRRNSCELQVISQHLATGCLSLGQNVSQLWSCFIWCFLQWPCCRYICQKPLVYVPPLPHSYQESHCLHSSFPQYTKCLKKPFPLHPFKDVSFGVETCSRKSCNNLRPYGEWRPFRGLQGNMERNNNMEEKKATMKQKKRNNPSHLKKPNQQKTQWESKPKVLMQY